jgi:hypothetical protein
MKRTRILSLPIFASLCSCLTAHAALLPISVDKNSPYYADFDTTGLSVSYNYNSGSGVGTFTVNNNGNAAKGESYTSHSSSPGTGGVINGNNSPFAFNGFYSITATIQNINSQWQVTGGSFSVAGSLFGGANTDLLLTGTLQTGAQTFGFDSSLKELEFLFTTGSSGRSAILSDFLGAGAGHGAIELNWGALNFPNSFSLTQSWQNNGTGFASTFVPEPVFYPLAAAGTAMFGLVLARRKSLA